jgi:hypothetical protein
VGSRRTDIHEASADRIDSMCEHDRHGLGYSLQRRHCLAGRGQDYIRGERSQFSREFTIKRGFASCPADFNPHVLTFGPTQFLQSLPERRYASLSLRVILWRTHEHTDPRNLPALLRPRGNWPYDRRAAEKCDELASSHRRP